MFLHEIKDLQKGDVFIYENDICKVTDNKKISKSYSEVSFTINEGSRKFSPNPIRERSDKKINIIEKSSSLEEQKKMSSYVRNSRGNVISVNFEKSGEGTPLVENTKNPILDLLTEKERKKITKPQMKRRDEIADEIQSDPDFNKRYNKSENVKRPAKNKTDIAYAIATLIATGRGNQIKRGKKKGKKSKKEQQNESLIRINTLREAIRRISQ